MEEFLLVNIDKITLIHIIIKESLNPFVVIKPTGIVDFVYAKQIFAYR
tara:strand:+ start:191 stop:334 length:144 start_codon:yes stop_codon:yes gene_type:complete